MTTHEEFSRIVGELEHAAQELELLILQFRRLERDLWPESEREWEKVRQP